MSMKKDINYFDDKTDILSVRYNRREFSKTYSKESCFKKIAMPINAQIGLSWGYHNCEIVFGE